MRRAKSDYSIQTVANALTLLEAFEHAETLGVSELSRRLALHKNNVFRLLATLEERGWIEQVPEGDRYRLGLRCLDLGQSFVRSRSLLREARAELAALAAESGETAHLAVLRGVEIVHLAGEQPDRLLLAGLRVGRRLPAYCTALGKALLGCSDDSVREAYDRSVSDEMLVARTPSTVVDRIKLVEQWRAAASAGFAIDLEECEPGLCCAAAPVLDGMGRVVAALSITGPASRLPEATLLGGLAKRVVEHADALSTRLGRARV